MISRFILAGLLVSTAYTQTYSTHQDPILDTYIRQALERNPAVLESFARYQSSLQRLPQESSLPDPMLGFTQFARSPETRVGAQTMMLSLSQEFPWFGKLSDKGKIAAKQAAAHRQHYEAQNAEIVRQVKLAYYSVSYIDRAIEINQEDLSVLQHYETLAQAQYTQGVGLQQAVVKLQTEITRDQNRLEVLRSQRVNAEAVLNSLMDRPANSPIQKIEQGARPRPEMNYGELLVTGRNNRPEIQAALLQIEKDEKRIHLARKSYWPNFTIATSFTNVTGRSDPMGQMNLPDQNGKNIYSFSVGINIPFQRRKYDAAVREATEDKIASRESYRDIVNEVEASIRTIGFRLETLETQIALFENTLLPQTEHTLTITEVAYSTGSVGVLDLLDSERVLLEVRLGLARLISNYMKSLAEMERTIGMPF